MSTLRVNTITNLAGDPLSFYTEGNISAVNNKFNVNLDGDGAVIEIEKSDGSYIDFKRSSSEDYDARIHNFTSGGIGINNNLYVNNNITNGGFDFILGNTDQSSRGNSGDSRALVKTPYSTGSQLVVNFAKDFSFGVAIDGPVLGSVFAAVRLHNGSTYSTSPVGSKNIASVSYPTTSTLRLTFIQNATSVGNLVYSGMARSATHAAVYIVGPYPTKDDASGADFVFYGDVSANHTIKNIPYLINVDRICIIAHHTY